MACLVTMGAIYRILIYPINLISLITCHLSREFFEEQNAKQVVDVGKVYRDASPSRGSFPWHSCRFSHGFGLETSAVNNSYDM